MDPKTLLIPMAVFAACMFASAVLAEPQTSRTSGVYMTAADYKEGRLAFRGDCRSKAHKLEIHDVLHKPYIDVTHESEKHRYLKNDVFGFRACDGNDYRFGSNLEYRILEARELYIYAAREVPRSYGKGFHTGQEYYFSVGVEGQVRALTLENLKETCPENHKFHESLKAAFVRSEQLSEYDKRHQMFKVNWLLIASRDT